MKVRPIDVEFNPTSKDGWLAGIEPVKLFAAYSSMDDQLTCLNPNDSVPLHLKGKRVCLCTSRLKGLSI